jgi:hypothetical protein
MQSLSMENISNIVMACVVLHNIILEDESGLGLDSWDSSTREGENRTLLDWNRYLQATQEIENSQ